MKKVKDNIVIDLSSIKNPNDIKSFSYGQIDMLCAQLRNELLNSISINGGHLSSNLGDVEATVALCKTFDFDKDKIIFDVGHQSYCYKMLTGRSLERLRKEDGVSGFQKISESKYDHFECGHSSTSISAAHGMAVARDLKGEKYNIISFIGDGSIANGLAFEGLNVNASSNHKIIIVINDNEMSISQPVGGLSNLFRKFSTSATYTKTKSAYKKLFKWNPNSKLYRFGSKIKDWFKRHLIKMNMYDNMGFSFIGPVDGHNIKKMEKAFEKAKKQQRSTIVLLKTIKGKGYSYAENDKTGQWHGVGKFDIATGKPLDEAELTWSMSVSDAALESMRNHQESLYIMAATGLGSEASPIEEEFPKRTIDVGIAEEHAITMSSALALNGFHPIIAMYSTFLQRAYDQLSHDLSRLKCSATLLIDRAGLSGGDGDTHQGIYDVGFLSTIPNTVITMPTRISQLPSLMEESYKHQVFAIRYPKRVVNDLISTKEEVKFAKWIKETNLSINNAIVSVGPITEQLLSKVKENSIKAAIYSAIYLKPFDEEALKELLSYKKIIIYDAYSTYTGFTSSIEARLLELGYKGEIIAKCIPDAYVPHGSISYQLSLFDLEIDDILKLI